MVVTPGNIYKVPRRAAGKQRKKGKPGKKAGRRVMISKVVVIS